MGNARILLGDDHSLILDGIRATLEPDFQVVGQARDGMTLVKSAAELRPELVLLDISMPGLNGFDSARQIRGILPTIKLIFLSQHLNPAYLREALKIGVSGYVLKSETSEELQHAIAKVLRGETYISPSFGEDVIANLWNRSKELNDQSPELTGRQREILQLIVEGRGNKEIADVLNLSIKTIEFHRAKIMNKLAVRTAAELARVALRRGLLPE